jgi:hypothetical protein
VPAWAGGMLDAAHPCEAKPAPAARGPVTIVSPPSAAQTPETGPTEPLDLDGTAEQAPLAPGLPAERSVSAPAAVDGLPVAAREAPSVNFAPREEEH